MIDGIPVIDAVVHPYNLREDNFRNKYARWITDLVSNGNRDSGPPGYRMSKQAYERDWSIEEVANMSFERIRYPTLVIAGAEDKLRLPGYHEVLGRIPDSRIVVLAEAGHLLNIEKASEFNGLVRQFLVEHDADGEADG